MNPEEIPINTNNSIIKVNNEPFDEETIPEKASKIERNRVQNS